MLKRLFDILISGVGLICLSPLFVILALWVKFDSKGPVFYRQIRVGKGNRDFELLKFRSMRVGSDSLGLITIGDRDPRITSSGFFIRRYKLDELPQLINVFRGDMSLVGPRPEVRRYVDMYTEEQLHVLDVRPGITDAASIKYRNESELLAQADDSDKFYIETVMPDKLSINLEYVHHHSVPGDIWLILRTFGAIVTMPRLDSIDYLPRWAVLLLDITLCLFSFLFSVWAGSYFFTYTSHIILLPITVQALILIMVQLAAFCIFRTFSGVLRYSTFIDTMKVLLAIFSATSTVLVVNNILKYGFGVQFMYNTATIMYFFISSTLLFSVRLVIKTIYEAVMQHSSDVQRVMIYGTRETALSIAKMLRSSTYNRYWPVGFITDHREDTTKHDLMGMKVYTRNESLIPLLIEKGVKAVIITPQKLQAIGKGTNLAEFVEHGIDVLTSPGISDISMYQHAQATAAKIESIKAEDLLERPAISIDADNVRASIAGQRVMVTGAAGSIGSELVRQTAAFAPACIVLLDMAESPLHDLSLELKAEHPEVEFVFLIGDIRHRDTVRSAMQQYRPDIVFHAAAYKHVPLMELQPAQAVMANIQGTRNVADTAVECGVKTFILISTDKAVNPANVMGATKRIAEMYCQALGNRQGESSTSQASQASGESTRFIATRFGNVLGSNGSVIPYFKKQIAAGGPVTVTHRDIIRYFMTIPEAVSLVLEATAIGRRGDILVFDMGQPVRIYDLACNMIRLAGLTPDVDIKIEITGLRPGEKIIEEFISGNVTPTANEKIMCTDDRQVAYTEICRQFDELNAIISSSSNSEDQSARLVKKLKEIVPEYKS